MRPTRQIQSDLAQISVSAGAASRLFADVTEALREIAELQAKITGLEFALNTKLPAVQVSEDSTFFIQVVRELDEARAQLAEARTQLEERTPTP